MARVDYDEQAERYDAGRTLPDDTLAVWMATVRRHAGEADRVLDLGSGTGRFSAALADAFDADVLAVEPSDGMRAQAATKQHTRVAHVGGRAEQLPLKPGTVDVAWLASVFHHLDDTDAAAAEIARILRPGGTVFVRGAFGGRKVPGLFRFFPAAEAIIDTFPSITEAIWSFERAGFSSFYTEQITEVIAPNLAAIVPRIKQRADTTLTLMSDEEFEAGVAKLEKAARTEDEPVYDPIDLLVIR